MEKTFTEISKPTWVEQSVAGTGKEEGSEGVLEEPRPPAQDAARAIENYILPPTSGFILPAEVVNAAVHSLPYPRVNTANASISSSTPSK